LSDNTALNRIQGLWFSNDTLIIRSENSIFRVSKSILAARSSVFRTMFELPQPPSVTGDATIVGSPVVILHHRAAETSRCILHSLTMPWRQSYFILPLAEDDFDIVLGILHLSHKYDIDYPYRRALIHLETLYPVDLAGLRN
ncbi:hypothetical protein C8R44DRAFT_552213, partial [Mycena epipterygia]